VPRPVAVSARPGYRLWLRFDDGVEGEVDLSRLVGRGVFRVWERPGVFEQVTIAEGGGIAWPGDVELCPDALYLEITGQHPEDVFLGLSRAEVDA
jgi:hypothetical protein